MSTAFFVAAAIALSACGSPRAAGGTEEERSSAAEIQTEGIQMTEAQTQDMGGKDRDAVSSREPQKEAPPTVDSTKEYVGLNGHIKEIRGDQVLISSDTDDFPGVFWAEGVEALAAEEDLKGGIPVFVLMEDTGRQESDGVRIFGAEQFMVLPEDEERGEEDILLTSVPSVKLTDMLSSKISFFEVRSGNFSWSTAAGGGELSTMVGCGRAPLDEAASESAARLKLPTYNGADGVYYSFSTVIPPDRLVICRWSGGDAGKEDVAPECVITYYCPVFGIELEKDKVYHFAAEWNEDNLERRGFGGQAGYVLVTE